MKKQSSVSQNRNEDPHPGQPTQNSVHVQLYLSNKPHILDEDNFSKSFLTHFKNSKSISYTSRYDLFRNCQSIKECQRILKAQHQLTKLNFLLETDKPFENKHLLLPIRSFSSLSSFKLKFSYSGLNDTISQQVLSKSLVSLKQLKHLDLSFLCFIFGDSELFKVLAKIIRKAIKVSSLSLTFTSCNGLTSLHYSFLFSSLSKLNHLQTLKLNLMFSHDLLDADIKTLISVLPKLSLLTKIDLNFGASGKKVIQGSTLVNLFKAFQSMKNLSDIVFSTWGCQLVSRDPEKSLLESLRCLVGSSIKKLNWNVFQNFSNKNLNELSEALKELTLLESLSLGIHEANALTNKSIAEFGAALACMTSLTSLCLCLPRVIKNKNIVQTIASVLMSLQNLVSLRLYLTFNNETEDQQFQILFTNFKYLRSLKYLDIQISDQKKITNTSLEILGKSLKDLNLLKTFSLDLTSVLLITNKGIEAICSGIQKSLSNLFQLSLTLNESENVNDKVLMKIGKSLNNLVSLYSFALCFSGCLKRANLKELFNSLKQMRNIQEIRLLFPDSEVNFKEIDDLKKIKNVTFY